MDSKDWTGNKTSIFTTLGASSHAFEERQVHDYYATDPIAMELLLAEETFHPVIWEPACGEGHLSKVLESHGYKVTSTDLYYRGFGREQELDFLKTYPQNFPGDIITNPPYKYAQKFIEHALDIVGGGRKVAMFLKVQFLEGKARKKLFLRQPPRTVYVFSSRVNCAKNGDFDEANKKSPAVAYAWFVWEKGFKGDPIIKWIN